MSGIEAEDVVQYFNSLDYPLKKDELVDAVSKRQAPQNFLEQITGLPNELFESPSDVSIILGRNDWNVDDF